MRISLSRFCVVLMAVLGILAPCTSEAVVLKSHFLTHQGMYWNFSQDNSTAPISWAITGYYGQRGIGPVLVLVQDNNRFLALREEWDGIYLCGQYGPDSFMVPEKPLLFFPAFIEFDAPRTTASRCKIYTTGENVSLKEELDCEVTFALKSMEDIAYDGREIRNCAVLEITSKAGNQRSVETWLTAPGIGPVKREIISGTAKRTYNLISHRRFNNVQPRSYTLMEYFPLTTDLLKTYTEPNGQRADVKVRSKETWSGSPLIPYVEPDGDIYYLATDTRGLIAPAKFVSLANLLNLYLPPDIPAVILPHRLVEGELFRSISYYRACQWPIIKPWLDFYPESNISSLLVGTDNVTTPLGRYKDCLKICLVSVTRATDMQMEKVRVGFIWLAKGTGIVKQQSLSLAAYYLPQSQDFIWAVQDYLLAEVKKTVFPPAQQPEFDAAQPESDAGKGEAPPQELSWQQNSRAMFDAAIAAAPFFVRSFAREKLFNEITKQAGAGGRVTEDTVIAAIKEAVSEKQRDMLLEEMEKLRTK